MKHGPEKWITALARGLELAASAVVLAGVVVAGAGLLLELGLHNGAPLRPEAFDGFLAHALGLVIGIEFIKMLVKHTPGAAIEVLLYAIARQLIVEHTSTYETLAGILAIAGVFAIRKFLFIRSFDGEERYVFPANRRVSAVNLLTMVRIPAPSRESTVGAVLQSALDIRGTEAAPGASAAFDGVALRVASLDRDGSIATVEVLPDPHF